jgi:hypothetical protein
MEKRVYITSGVGYSVEFNSIKDRNKFNKQVKSLFEKMQKDDRFKNNLTALNTSISIATANAFIKNKVMEIKLNTCFKKAIFKT